MSTMVYNWWTEKGMVAVRAGVGVQWWLCCSWSSGEPKNRFMNSKMAIQTDLWNHICHWSYHSGNRLLLQLKKTTMKKKSILNDYKIHAQKETFTENYYYLETTPICKLKHSQRSDYKVHAQKETTPIFGNIKIKFCPKARKLPSKYSTKVKFKEKKG